MRFAAWVGYGSKQKKPVRNGTGCSTDDFDYLLSAHARLAPTGMAVEMMDVVVRGDAKHGVIVSSDLESRNRG